MWSTEAVTWSQSDWAALHLLQTRQKANRPHTRDEGSCSLGWGEHQQAVFNVFDIYWLMTSGSHWLLRHFQHNIKYDYSVWLHVYLSNNFWTPKLWTLCHKGVISSTLFVYVEVILLLILDLSKLRPIYFVYNWMCWNTEPENVQSS